MGAYAQASTRREMVDAKALATAELLAVLGWRRAPDGWRHPRLSFAWPQADADLLQAEADDGRQGLVYEMLRGTA